MTIQIDIAALQPSEKELIFRSGSLGALQQITESGFILILAGGALSKEQQQLLDQESIEIISQNQTPDFTIRLNGNSLLLLDNNEKVIEDSFDWSGISKTLTQPKRIAELSRSTNETDISIKLNLDGTGISEIDTGLKFFDHMLEQIARHGLVDLNIRCNGDLEVDEHHTIEDVAIALGETISKALGDKKGLERYGFVLAMDEAQATVALDLSNRPYLVFDVPMKREYVGDFPTEMLEHFFYSLAMNLKATLHVTCSGNNDHHKIEACFKGFARALKTAIEQNGRIKNQIPSSKGSL